ncbi:MAG: hypothetical protein IJT82_09555 [Schwartzia sp.]|nr:hypothetical protein [Schwartzia sp. (in: firmicutes)]
MMSELKEYYHPAKLFIVGKVMLAINLLLFLRNIYRFPFLVALLVLAATLSCSLPILYHHRQRSIADGVFFRRIILPSFLGMTLSVLMISMFGADWARLPYGISHREAMGIFFENKGLFFLIMSNVSLIQMVLKEAVPKEKRMPYFLLLVVPLLLLASV